MADNESLTSLSYEEMVKGMLDEMVRREYGGCDPRVDNPCVLKAMVVHDPPVHCIKVFVVGKWRTVRGYGGYKKVVTNKKILADMEHTVRINTGSYNRDKPFGQNYDPSKGMFAGKEIQFNFITEEGAL